MKSKLDSLIFTWVVEFFDVKLQELRFAIVIDGGPRWRFPDIVQLPDQTAHVDVLHAGAQ